MGFKTSKMSIFVLTSISAAWLAACSPQFGTSSNDATPVKAANPPVKAGPANPSQTKTEATQDQIASKITLGNELQKYLEAPEIPATPELAQEIKLSETALADAEKNNYEGITNDGDPNDAFSTPAAYEGLFPQKPAEEPKNQTKKPESQKPDSKPAPSIDKKPESHASTPYKNPYCEKLGTNGCIKASDQPIVQSWYYYAKMGNLTGKLSNATALPLDGTGYHVKANSKLRRYGSYETVDLVETLAKLDFPNKLIIGDMSQSSGGFIGHKSHQNGLDVDIGFIGLEKDLSLPDVFPANFIKNGKLDSSKFDLENNWKLVSEAVATGSTYIIFAHTAIKKAFCERAKKSPDGLNSYMNKKVLSQIISEDDHFNHFHIRLKCVASSPCIPAPIRPEDHGCN